MSLKFQRYIKCKVWQKWQLFHATDFQSLMYPCFTFCRIFGLFPYRINASTFETTKQLYFWTTFITCIFCIYELIILYWINITGTINFVIIPVTFERNCFFILGGFIRIVTYILNGPRMRLLQNVMEISLRLSPDSYRKLSKLIHAKDIFGFFFLVGRITFYYYIINFGIIDKILVLYITFTVFQMDMLYINCVCVLKACFKEVNDNLKNLRKLVVNDKPHLLRRIYHEQRNPFLLTKLQALRKQHLMISDTVQMLNTTFSLQLLATIVLTFAELTFYLYFYIIYWEINMKNHMFYVMIYIISLMYYCIKISLMGWACDTGKDEAIKIGTNVHEILNDTIDEQIKDELQLFSMQVLNRENTFSAKGLILDATLLVAIVSNITTYLLILIQFLITDKVCNKKVTNDTT
ncbi:Putative gustatory receptor 28b [Trachymyrmex septentrionalis]|uniref:Gustatory receptor n=1 Tax=Trachymyrmex septentrionalis TaxID=34720 RepID=A0A195F2B5_9HYME|nr:PREDICTED: putative gustatory receptor 28a [Trachymyrmex septentrionalis]KYN34229.1 Putative gustatory receptor 28b [Trachymyrmex septentrionalis]